MELGDILAHIKKLEDCLTDVECDDGSRDDCAMHLAEIYRRCGKALYEFVQTDEQLEIVIDSVVGDGLVSLWVETGTLDPYLIRSMKPQFSDYTIEVLGDRYRGKLREAGLVDEGDSTVESETVYLLWHTHLLPDGNDDDKLLGVYSSGGMAGQAEGRLGKLPGFCQSDGEFSMSEYRIDEDHWTEGFVTV